MVAELACGQSRRRASPCPSSGEAYTDSIASGSAQQVGSRIWMGAARGSSAADLEKDVTDCEHVRRTSLETRQARIRLSVRPIEVESSMGATWR